MKPLEGILVLDFSQFLAGPSAALRLADLGARVIKVERPGTGDMCRQLYNGDLELDGDSVLFHTINRNKESFIANLKEPEAVGQVKALIQQADVMIENYRPGVMARLGLNYEALSSLNPRLVYAKVTGYGSEGPWRDKPGQDLLVQAISGLTWLNGNADMPPTPFAQSVVDMFAGANLVQGVLACLVRRGITERGGLVEVSLIETALDIQFEVFTTYLNDGGQLPQRSAVNNANAYLAAPYGIYPTADGFLALAMSSITQLGELLSCEPLLTYTNPKSWFSQRDEIKRILVEHLQTQTTAHWLGILEPADIWCADVLTWRQLTAHEGFKALNMVQMVGRSEQIPMKATRCPIRVDGRVLTAAKGAPRLGEDTERLQAEFGLS